MLRGLNVECLAVREICSIVQDAARRTIQGQRVALSPRPGPLNTGSRLLRCDYPSPVGVLASM